MGVRHLQTYICNDVPDGYKPVSIADEVENWKRNNKEQPIIVIDVLAIAPSAIYPNLGVSLCGGRHQFIIKEFSKFFKRLTDLGVKLVFFRNGSCGTAKYEKRVKRQANRYMYMLDILDDVSQNMDSKELVRKYNDIPHSMDISPLTSVCTKFGEFHYSRNAEFKLEIAQFATNNNVLAVLADDTDFLIYEGNWKYWDSKTVDHNLLTTMEYNKNALLEHLGLSAKQMPLLATIAGNDIVKWDLVKHLYPYKKKFPLIARYVKFNRNYPDHMSNEVIKGISYHLFESRNREQTDLVVESLESYDINRNISASEPIDDEFLLRSINEVHGNAYDVLTGVTICFTIVFFDFSNPDFRNYFELIERLILRPMGVLLQHKNDPNLRRMIETKINERELYGELEVTPEYPPIEVPSLMKLLYDQNDEEIIETRYQLLAWMISDRIDREKLKEIPEIYLSDILTLIYLQENEQITPIEFDSVLRTIYDVYNNLVPADVSTPMLIDERAMRFSFLYLKIYHLIGKCLCTVGFFNLETQFDSLYYHTIYKVYKTVSEEERQHLTINLVDLRGFCLDEL